MHLSGMRFDQLYDALVGGMRCGGTPVKTERWQGVQANTDTLELLNVDLEVNLRGIESLDSWRQEIQPNLPWADDHFQERVGGEPLNPGVQWENWPWGRSAARFKGERFNHTYMERLWPKFARRTSNGALPLDANIHERKYPEKDARPKQGTAWSLGDLQDLVELLVAEPHTRQAYIPLFFPEDTGRSDGGRKVCTLGYQMIVRPDDHEIERAHIWYPMRSCDLIRHFRDDCYLAVRLLLWVLERCRSRDDWWQRVLPGTYSMHMTSLHVFKGDKL